MSFGPAPINRPQIGVATTGDLGPAPVNRPAIGGGPAPYSGSGIGSSSSSPAPALAPSQAAVGPSPFRVQTNWLTYWPGVVTQTGSGVATVKLAGDDTELVYPLETSAPLLHATVRVAFGEGGRCAIVGVIGGF